VTQHKNKHLQKNKGCHHFLPIKSKKSRKLTNLTKEINNAAILLYVVRRQRSSSHPILGKHIALIPFLSNEVSHTDCTLSSISWSPTPLLLCLSYYHCCAICTIRTSNIHIPTRCQLMKLKAKRVSYSFWLNLEQKVLVLNLR
jgi:hypothetical protein